MQLLVHLRARASVRACVLVSACACVRAWTCTHHVHRVHVHVHAANVQCESLADVVDGDTPPLATLLRALLPQKVLLRVTGHLRRTNTAGSARGALEEEKEQQQ